MPSIIGSLLISSAALVAPLSPPDTSFIANEATQAIVEEATTENTDLPSLRIESLTSAIGKEFGVSSTTLYNVALSESGLDPDPPGHNDGGLAAGLVQIHYETWHVTKEQALDPEFSLRFLAKRLKAGDAWKYWTSLNCYTYVSHLVTLPRMTEIVRNTSVPHTGEVAIFWYRDKNTGAYEKHVAYVSEVSGRTFTVKEANFKGGLIGTRVINIFDPHLSGFWDPKGV